MDVWRLFPRHGLVVQDRTPEDAAHIVQRICGVCPVSHAHASSIAAEKAYGIEIPNNARIIRNLIEAVSSCTATFCGSTPWQHLTT